MIPSCAILLIYTKGLNKLLKLNIFKLNQLKNAITNLYKHFSQNKKNCTLNK